MAGLPTSEQLREQSLRCREAAQADTDASRRQILASCALALAQLAEHIERGKPVDADVVRRMVEHCDSIIGKTPGDVPVRKPVDERAADFQRVAAIDRIRFLRQKAEECRAVAGQFMFPDTRAIYYRLADTYDAVATREEERLAGTAKVARECGSAS